MGDVRFALVAAGVLSLVTLDVYLYVTRGPDAALSTQLRTWCALYPIVPFLIGLVLGHLLWPLR